MRNIFVFLFTLPVLLAGVIILQIFLSKRESRWPGLILPIISFGVSLIYVLNAAVLGDLSAAIMSAALVFIIGNIPTAVLLAVYAACRGTRNRKRDLDKMNLQDLK